MNKRLISFMLTITMLSCVMPTTAYSSNINNFDNEGLIEISEGDFDISSGEEDMEPTTEFLPTDTDSITSGSSVVYPVTDGYIYFDTTTATIYKADDSITYAAIPDEIAGIAVKNIGNAFQNKRELTGVVLPYALDRIPSYAFEGCTSLTDIEIPQGVKVIEYSAFRECSSLEWVYLHEGLTDIELRAFEDCPIKEITLPSTLENMDTSAFGELAITLAGPMPEGQAEDFHTYYYYPNVGMINVYKDSPMEKYLKSIDYWPEYYHILDNKPSDKQVLYSLNVTDNSGKAVDNVVVNWFDGSKYIGSGSKIRYDESDNIYYDIYLNEDVGLVYYSPERQKAAGDVSALSYTLKEIPHVNISGKALDESGTPIADAEVEILQSANGYSKKDIVKTLSDGSFSANILNTDTKLTVKKDMYYDFIYTLISENNIKDSYDEANIIMKKLPANKITLEVTAVKATDDASSTAQAYADISELDFTLFNKTQNKAVSDFTYQYPYIILGDNDAGPNDTITISVNDKSGKYAGEAASVILDDAKNGLADIRLVENGYFTANTLTEDEKLVLLFDEKGNFVWKTVFDGAALTSDNIAAGNYTAVIMEKTTLLSNINNISALDDMGLKEKTDYIAKPLTIKAGAITNLGNVNVPLLDETKLFYTDTENTSVYLSKNKTTIGFLLQVTAKYKLKDDFDGSVKNITIELPENVSFVEKSLIVRGADAKYSYNGKTLTVFTDKTEGLIRFCVMCNASGDFSIEGYIGLNSSGRDILQPIGSCSATADLMDIEAPERTGKTKILVSGSSYPDSDITIYVDEKEAQKTNVNYAGNYTAEVDLGESYVYQKHRIYGISTNQFGTFTTKTAEVVYDPTAPMLDKITIISGGNVKVLDFNNKSTKVESYTTYYYGVTYKVEFRNAAPDMFNKVYVVTVDKSGEKTYIPCVYNERNDFWLCSYDYGNSGNMPVSVSAAYEINSKDEIVDMFDSKTIDNFAEDYSELTDALSDELDKRLEPIDIVNTSDNGFSIKLGIRGDDDVVSDFGTLDFETADISQFNLNDWKNKSYIEFENNSGSKMYLLTETDDESVAIYYEYVIPDEGVYLKIHLNISAVEESMQVLDTILEDIIPDYAAPLMAAPIQSYGRGLAGDIFSGAVGLISPSAASIIDDFRYSAKANDYTDELHKKNSQNYDLIMAVCENTGKPRLSAANKLKYLREYDVITDEILAYRKECTNQIKKWAIAGCIGEGIGAGINLLSKAPKVAAKATKFGKSLSSLISKNLSGKSKMAFDALTDSVSSLEGFINDKIFRATMNIPEDATIYIGNNGASVQQLAGEALDAAVGNYMQKAIVDGGLKKLFDSISEMDAMYYIENKYKYLMQYINNTKNNILKDYENCDEEPEEPDEPANSGTVNSQNPMLESSKPFKSVTPIIDPSGYVYEAVPSNRLDNVKTSIYYMKDVVDEFGMPTGEQTAVLWNAEDYGQENPLLTDTQGGYMWDVPEGSWQVKYEKDGYNTAYSEWLPVPPPQLDINQALVSEQAPEVLYVNVYNDEVEVIFSKYMKLSAADKIKVLVGDKEIVGEVAAVNAEYNAENTEMYATIFKFTPAENISGDVNVKVEDAEGYNSLVAKNYDVTKTAVVKPQYINVPESVNVGYGNNADIKAQILPREAAAGLNIEANVLSEDISTIDRKTATADENGFADFKVNGSLLGQTEIKFTIPGTAISKTVTVNVLRNATQKSGCEKVSASIASGSTVDYGTKLSLSTPTEGAEIYYTLDGTCPCVVDSPSRIKYTGPITLTEDTFIIAYAVKDGMADSDTAGFIYTVKKAEDPPASGGSSGGSSGGGGGSRRKTATTTEATTEATTSEKTTEATTEEKVIYNDVRVSIGSKIIDVGNKKYIIDAAPYIQPESNSTLVPLRFAAIAISGGDVEKADSSSAIKWDAATKTATVTVKDKSIKFTAGSELMYINNTPVVMENGVKAEIKNSRMFIPFRALGNALGVAVSWEADTKTAIFSVK